MCGKTCRGKGGRRSKGSGRPSDSVAAAERVKIEDAQECVIFHQALKSVSSLVRMIIGLVIVQRWMMALRIRRNETLEPAQMVRGPATILTILVMKSVHQSRFKWIPCVVRAVFPVQVESEGFDVLDCAATNSFGSVEGAEALFSKTVMRMIREFQRLIRLDVDHSILGMVIHQRLLPCPDPQSEMMFLVNSGSMCVFSWISRNRLH